MCILLKFFCACVHSTKKLWKCAFYKFRYANVHCTKVSWQILAFYWGFHVKMCVLPSYNGEREILWGGVHVKMCLLSRHHFTKDLVWKMCILSAVSCMSCDAVQIMLVVKSKRSDTIEADQLLNSTFKILGFLYCLRFKRLTETSILSFKTEKSGCSSGKTADFLRVQNLPRDRLHHYYLGLWEGQSLFIGFCPS